jgi:alanine racemase
MIPARSRLVVTRPTVAEIDLRAIAFNLKGIRKHIGEGVKILGVVKANAYGHGLIEVARFLENGLVEYLGVAIAEEGAALRRGGMKAPIHVFTLPSRSQAALYAEHRLDATVCSLTDCQILNSIGTRFRRTIPVHIKIDTGMNRIGIKPVDLRVLLKAIAKLRRIEIKGVFTHFATSDARNKRFAREQLQRFLQALDIVHAERVGPELVHTANSGAILDLPEASFSMVRPGIISYGYYPSHETTESIPLKPAMKLRTVVALVKRIEPGESVSYNRRFIAKRRTRIATLPVGYADGYTRLLTGKGSVVIHGKEHPVVGTIGMDQMMVDVGRADVAAGDEALLIGAQGKARVDAWDLASRLGTVPLEIVTAITTRVPRTYRGL